MQTGMIDRFVMLWQAGDPAPDVFAFLNAQANLGVDDQLTIVFCDQRNRWATDRPFLVEDYLAKLPELAANPGCAFDLVLGEIAVRRFRGLPARVDEYLARFDDLGSRIREHFAGLEADESPLLDSTCADWTTRDGGFGDNEAEQGSEASTGIVPPSVGKIGRYKLIRLLGEGAFGRVYLGFDEELGRRVAIKVPAPERFRSPRDAEAFLIEARMAARLDHLNIVPVYDVGRSADGSIFVVSKLIEGRTLKDLIRDSRPGHAEGASLLAQVARALHHAHQRRLIHRDVKPGNILIEDETGTPYVADFGLAIRDEDYPRAGHIAGTPAYMSPEQARGEGHRLDGRSDIFSLGIVLYEVLTGRKPFFAYTPISILSAVVSIEPPPPRELDPTVPPELERICIKALAKQASDRYQTMKDLADDLARWAQDSEPVLVGLPIIPRGLRAFGADDAAFFPDLLPGLRDRQGLPEAIRFWKERIEELDAEKTFNVGLLYGPSGCGKSSLMRAGLLPRLAPGIFAVCVDASPDDTEGRILRALRKLDPGLPGDRGLAETFAAVRRGVGRKVVVVLDQFEQWLHAQGGVAGPELVDALRQCDGGRLQAVIMVRDDFAMAAARFMDALDIPIVQGHNFATLDLFDVGHARLVLARFGQAFGQLPAGPAGPSADQRRFLDAVASGLARDGKVIPVRLALFAEMVKTRPWVPATLEEAGGTEGIGVNFLEETFNSRSANPRHRLLEGPARNVLKALLPGVGSDIKGNLRSSAGLQQVSGLGDRPADFAALLRVLDGELRLLTPTDPPEWHSSAGSDAGATYWQLTHDYLVPSLRQWLNRKQNETRRGRAELRLEDRAASWSARRENRQLPTLWEWVGIRTLTDRARWTTPQRAMMRRAGQLHGFRLAIACSLAIACLAGSWMISQRTERLREQARVDGLVDQLVVADIADLPEVAAALARLPPLGAQRLRAIASDPEANRKVRLRASYALANGPGTAASRLIDLAASSDHHELAVIRPRLAGYSRALADEIWEAANQKSADPAAQLRLAALLAGSDDEGWRELAGPVVDTLLTMETLDLDAWAELLRPAAPTLTPQLRRRFFDASAIAAERVNAARVLARYAGAALLSELLLEANVAQFSILFPAAQRHKDALITVAGEALRRWDQGPPVATAWPTRGGPVTPPSRSCGSAGPTPSSRCWRSPGTPRSARWRSSKCAISASRPTCCSASWTDGPSRRPGRRSCSLWNRTMTGNGRRRPARPWPPGWPSCCTTGPIRPNEARPNGSSAAGATSDRGSRSRPILALTCHPRPEPDRDVTGG